MNLFNSFIAVSLLSCVALADNTSQQQAVSANSIQNNSATANSASNSANQGNAAAANSAKQQAVVGRNVRGSSLDDVRAACSNPAKYHNQQAPSNIQISCKDVRTSWQVTYEGTVELPTSRAITTSVQSDKMNVAPFVSTSRDIDAQQCPVYEEVQQTVETTRAVSCDDLSTDTRSGAEFCRDAIDSLLADNQSAATNPVATGRKVRLCKSAKTEQQPAQAMR